MIKAPLHPFLGRHEGRKKCCVHDNCCVWGCPPPPLLTLERLWRELICLKSEIIRILAMGCLQNLKLNKVFGSCLIHFWKWVWWFIVFIIAWKIIWKQSDLKKNLLQKVLTFQHLKRRTSFGDFKYKQKLKRLLKTLKSRRYFLFVLFTLMGVAMLKWRHGFTFQRSQSCRKTPSRNYESESCSNR